MAKKFKSVFDWIADCKYWLGMEGWELTDKSADSYTFKFQKLNSNLTFEVCWNHGNPTINIINYKYPYINKMETGPMPHRTDNFSTMVGIMETLEKVKPNLSIEVIKERNKNRFKT